MLGFKHYIYRQQDQIESPASFDSEQLYRLLSFETDIDGFKWLDTATKDQSLLLLGGNGYPYRYTGKAKDLIPHIERVINEAWSIRVATERESYSIPEWMVQEQDIVSRLSYIEALAQCESEEWLMIEVWDQS